MEQEYREHLVKYYTELYLDEPKVRKPRTTYSNLQRFEVLEFLATGKAVRATAKAFAIPKSTVADIKKTGHPGSRSVDKGKHNRVSQEDLNNTQVTWMMKF